MAIGPHPDDLEINCAGTLARCKERGDEVIMCVACNGSQGHYEIRSPHLQTVRRREARESAALLGAELILLDIPDSGVYPSLEQRALFTDAVRRARPDILLMPPPNDYMSDHTHTARLADEASFWCTVPLYETGARACPLPAAFQWGPMGAFGWEPTEYVDVSGVWDLKARMLLCHQTQYTWLRDHDNIDYVEFMGKIARFRGLQCGVQYAECFRPLPKWPRQRTVRLLP
jgi:N-acetylglucosamine malate deacetylase 1